MHLDTFETPERRALQRATYQHAHGALGRAADRVYVLQAADNPGWFAGFADEARQVARFMPDRALAARFVTARATVMQRHLQEVCGARTWAIEVARLASAPVEHDGEEQDAAVDDSLEAVSP